MNVAAVVFVFFYLTTVAPWRVCSGQRLMVSMTMVTNARDTGALCLDGSLPAYHLHRGFGAGQNNWLLQFEVDGATPLSYELKIEAKGNVGRYSIMSENKDSYKTSNPSKAWKYEVVNEMTKWIEQLVISGGGWCNDLTSCLERAPTRRGSTRYMNKLESFSGILSNNATLNPDFYNWNRVKLRYCDGASFTGDRVFNNGTTKLYFKGQKIWEAIIEDLLPKGLGKAKKALLSGCSAGGLATFHHCDNFTNYLPENTSVKCLSDAGFFLDGRDISLNHTMRYFVKSLVSLQGIEQNLNKKCINAFSFPDLCFFPQYALRFISTPYFILNSAYDVYQFHHIFVPPSADPRGHWNHCKLNLTECTPAQINVLQGFRLDMLAALRPFNINSNRGGMYINSCFAHCQSESQDTWFGANSPKINNKTIAEAVGDWYFSRNISKEIDCAYPCDKTCRNLVPS